MLGQEIKHTTNAAKKSPPPRQCSTDDRPLKSVHAAERHVARCVPVELEPRCEPTPEDAIVSKLEWARRSGDSERQVRDALGVLELNPAIDCAYVRWAEALGVADLGRRIAPRA
jgi:hypothetical protein